MAVINHQHRAMQEMFERISTALPAFQCFLEADRQNSSELLCCCLWLSWEFHKPDAFVDVFYMLQTFAVRVLHPHPKKFQDQVTLFPSSKTDAIDSSAINKMWWILCHILEWWHGKHSQLWYFPKLFTIRGKSRNNVRRFPTGERFWVLRQAGPCDHFTFTFMHFANAFIQSDFYCIMLYICFLSILKLQSVSFTRSHCFFM